MTAKRKRSAAQRVAWNKGFWHNGTIPHSEAAVAESLVELHWTSKN